MSVERLIAAMKAEGEHLRQECEFKLKAIKAGAYPSELKPYGMAKLILANSYERIIAAYDAETKSSLTDRVERLESLLEFRTENLR